MLRCFLIALLVSFAPVIFAKMTTADHITSILSAKTQAKIKKIPYFTIVIDAGHGGVDTGARGAKGVTEKNIVLRIAKQLANKLNQEKNIRAVLTRDGDYFLPLRKRLAIARKYNADLFIAIHADAYFNASARGASVYALSQHGATSEAAHWLARQENYAELGQVALNDLQDKSPMLRSVLIDLAQTATIRDSLRLGSKMLAALNPITTLHYPRVEQAPFMVLKSPDIPSVLVETGFISNPEDAEKLLNLNYQQKLVKALALGILHYHEQNQVLVKSSPRKRSLIDDKPVVAGIMTSCNSFS